jgi:uncharacterized protein YjcR
MKLIELKFGADLHELLRKDYMDSHMSIEQLADKYKVTPCTAHRWLKMYDIPRRKITFV